MDLQINHAVDAILEAHFQKAPLIVGVTAFHGKGISAGAGKTLLTQKLSDAIRDDLHSSVAVLHTDAFLLRSQDDPSERKLAANFLVAAISALREGQRVQVPVFSPIERCGQGAVFGNLIEGSDEFQMREHSRSIRAVMAPEQPPEAPEYSAADDVGNQAPEATEFSHGLAIVRDGHSMETVEPADFIIVEGVGLLTVITEIDVLIVGQPNEAQALRGYAVRWLNQEVERRGSVTAQEIDALKPLAWHMAQKQPVTINWAAINRSKFSGRTVIIDDYDPTTLFVGEPKVAMEKEMMQRVEVENLHMGTEFQEVQKMLMGWINNARWPTEERQADKIKHSGSKQELETLALLQQFLQEHNLFGKPVFRGGCHRVFISGGLVRDVVASNPREPQDFDLHFICREPSPLDFGMLEFRQLCKYLKVKQTIEYVTVRNLRKGKSIHFGVNGKDYEVDFHAIKSEDDLVEYLATQTNFTINCFYRYAERATEKLSVTDVTGMGVDDLRNRVIRWTPGHDFSHTDMTNDQNVLSAFLLRMKMANMASVSESGEISGLFEFSDDVQASIDEAIKRGFSDLPDWRRGYFVDKEVPTELAMIKDERIRRHLAQEVEWLFNCC